MTRQAYNRRPRARLLSTLLLAWGVAACETEAFTVASRDPVDAAALSVPSSAAADQARESPRLAASNDPCSDAVEPNDARGQAWLVDLDERIPATVCDGDIDWLAIDLPAAPVVSVRVESDHVERLKSVEAYRPRARKPLGTASSAPGAMVLTLTDVRAGRHRIRIAPREGQPPTAYTCVVRIVPEGSR
jgi:hypothetical protein